MALNVFKTRTLVLSTTSTVVYTAPTGYTSVVIMAQVSNTSNAAISVTVSHRAGATDTELVKGFNIPVNDSASVTTGKLVLETGQSVVASASVASSANIVLSILDTSNG